MRRQETQPTTKGKAGQNTEAREGNAHQGDQRDQIETRTSRETSTRVRNKKKTIYFFVKLVQVLGNVFLKFFDGRVQRQEDNPRNHRPPNQRGNSEGAHTNKARAQRNQENRRAPKKHQQETNREKTNVTSPICWGREQATKRREPLEKQSQRCESDLGEC